MASIQSGDVESLREAIVDPLVSMMSRLSGEMQKNLSEEVSLMFLITTTFLSCVYA